mgnify:CR=1 FL=1
MLRLKNFIGLGILVLAGLLIYYLFIKSYDYQIKFKAITAPGTVYYAIGDWEEALGKRGLAEVIDSKGKHFSNLDQNLKIGDSIINLNWKLQAINDTVTQITVRIKDLENSAATRWENIFKKPPLEGILISKMSDFKKGLDIHLKGHKVDIIGMDTIPGKFYAYVEIKSSLVQKARNMIANNGGILGWLREHGFEIEGKPTLEVTNWNVEKDSIIFNYMFPVNELDSLPEHSLIKFKKYPSRKAIKAIYHGNYRTSDRAWFALYDYAKRNQIDIEETPIEFFYDNPMMGGNELEWRAEIYMPLK